MISGLRSPRWRGRCDKLAAAASLTAPPLVSAAVRRDGRVPPPTQRLAALGPAPALRTAAGTAGWSAVPDAASERPAVRTRHAAVVAIRTAPALNSGSTAASGSDIQNRAAFVSVDAPETALARAAAISDAGVVRQAAVRGARYAPHTLAMLAASDSPADRAASAANRGCPPAILRALAAEAATTRTTSPDSSQALFSAAARAERDSAYMVEVAVAANPACPSDLLDSFAAGDAGPPARRAAITNPALSPATLDRLAASADTATRFAVAGNPSCPPAAIRRLSIDPDRVVLRQVASNPATPAEVLGRLAADTTTVLWAAAHRACPPQTLAVLVGSADHKLRSAAARNPALPTHLAERLAHDPRAAVRSTLAGHTSDPALLARLAADHDPDVLRAVVSNSACPPLVCALTARRNGQSAAQAAIQPRP